jgi:ADP-ribose pyrophosphatase YjhB (NUDIX family)
VPIYLKKSNQNVLASFGECVVKFFGFADQGSGYVRLTQENDGFVINEVDSMDDPNNLLLRHASECPVYKMTNKASLSQESKDRGVGMGVAILLTSLDQCVLVTRRAPHMRTFPGVWVPPGGHVEPGESLLSAGLRELKEETGLELKDTSHHLLGLWESVYPHKLEFGDPQRQHLVIYLVLTSNLSSKELTEQIMVLFIIIKDNSLLNSKFFIISYLSWILKKRMQQCGFLILLSRSFLRDIL